MNIQTFDYEDLSTDHKLDPAVKAKWVAALRSGKYKQGTGRLYDPVDDSYCCLGVANEVLGLGRSEYAGGLLEEEGWLMLPKGLQFELWDLNDIDQLSFCEIADWIDENL